MPRQGRAREDLQGQVQPRARDLTDPQWQSGVTDERIFNSITNGKGKMPSFKRKLTNEQTESLVAYVRGLKK